MVIPEHLHPYLNAKERQFLPPQHIAIIGNGAISQMLQAELLAESDVNTSVARRGEIEEVMLSEPDVVILATPNPVVDVAKKIAPHISKPFTLILPQNGVDVLSQTRQGLQNDQISLVRAAVLLPVMMDGETPVYNPDKRKVVLALGTPQDVGAMVKAQYVFRSAGFEIEINTNPHALEWTKLGLLNCLGTTAVVTGLSHEETFKDPELFDIELRGLIDRIDVIRALELPIAHFKGGKTRLLTTAAAIGKQFPSLRIPDTARDIIAKKISSARGGVPPAAARRVQNGGSVLEAIFYHQPFVERGRILGIHTPVDLTLATILKQQEIREITLQHKSTEDRRRLLLDLYHQNEDR